MSGCFVGVAKLGRPKPSSNREGSELRFDVDRERPMSQMDDRRESLLDALGRVPSRAEIRLLLEQYFVGPISEEAVERIEREFISVNASSGLSTMHQGRFESPTWWRGAAWYEESIDKRWMTPRDLVLMLADGVSGADDTFPQRRLYCPPKFVGVWEQLEPAPSSERLFWHLSRDGSFRTNSTEVPHLPLWCIDVSDDGRLECLSLREHAASGGGVWGSLFRMKLDGDELTAKIVALDPEADRLFRWRRCRL